VGTSGAGCAAARTPVGGCILGSTAPAAGKKLARCGETLRGGGRGKGRGRIGMGIPVGGVQIGLPNGFDNFL